MNFRLVDFKAITATGAEPLTRCPNDHVVTWRAINPADGTDFRIVTFVNDGKATCLVCGWAEDSVGNG